MGKVKTKRRNLSEVSSQGKKVSKKKLNPFEVHINRQKFDVVGRKLKSEKGLPGVSRSKAIKKRKVTLLQEYKIRDKANKFFDKRIGEKNRAMTNEDRVLARFTAERMKQYNKKQMFNLADDEVLTHRGQTLSEIEKFDDPRSDDEDFDDSGKLKANFVEDAHFGGGMLSLSEGGEKRSHKDLINELIAESKKRKAEVQRNREQTLELTEKLDSEWHDLLPIVAASKKRPNDVREVERPDSYDIAFRELKFEPRARASAPLIVEDKKEEEEQKKRAELEAERAKRMKDNLWEQKSQSKHRSADDLDDGCFVQEEQEVFVTYDSEGNPLFNLEQENPGMEGDNDNFGLNEDENESDGSEESDSQEEEENERNSQEEEENERNSKEEEENESNSKEEGQNESDSKEEPDNENDSKEEDDDSEEEEKSDDDSGETDDSLSDLREENEDEDSENENINTITKVSMPKGDKEKWKKFENKSSLSMSKPMTSKEREMFLRKLEKKFPNFTEIPEEYEVIQKVLEGFCPDELYVIVYHIMEMNHISLREENRKKLEMLFKFLLRFIDESATQDPVIAFKVLSCLAPVLYDLCHLSPRNASLSVLDVLRDKQKEFNKKYPSVSTVILFKIISLLFPTSDFRHRIVTPSLVYMSQILFQSRIKYRYDIAMGILVVTLILEYTVLSKRFCPAAVNFLSGILYLSIPKGENCVNKLMSVPPFKKSGPLSELLVLADKEEHIDDLKMRLSDLSDTEPIDNYFKIRTLATAVIMLNEFVSNLNHLPSCSSIFSCASSLLPNIPVQNYPISVQLEIKKLLESFSKLKEKELQYVIVERKRPKTLRSYEPYIETVMDVKRRRGGSKGDVVTQKLLHKIKRERKAAIREIRRDNSFLAKLKWKETVQSDAERIQKVKEIFGSAASQMGEIRGLERKKKKLK